MHAADELAALMGPVAREILGEPNKALSSAHELRWGTHGSISVDLRKGTWFDHEAGEGGGCLDFLRVKGGFPQRDAFEWLDKKGFRKSRINGNGAHHGAATIVAVYGYSDEIGDILFEVVRFDPKAFRQRRPDGKGGHVWSIHGVRRVPFRLSELNEAIALERVVWIVEGERDVLNLARIGVPATCNAMGAGAWHSDLNKFFAGADVIVVADNDPPTADKKTGKPRLHADGRPVRAGQDHALHVCTQLTGVAVRVRYLDLKAVWPACPSKGDISDWLAAGGTVEQLNAIAESLADWTPETAADNQQTALGEWNCGDDPGMIPPREWFLANAFCRCFVSSVVAGGGVGKTALRLLQYISLATARPLSGQHVFCRCRVLIISLEDDRNEMERRIKAVLDHYKIPRSELDGWLFCACPKLAKLAESKNHARVIGPLEAQITDAIDRIKPDLVALDPFVKTHALEENDAGDMDFVCSLLGRLAIERSIAVDAPHHVHKGTMIPGDADSGRGSSGIRDAGRLVYTLCPMSTEEAELFGIPASERCTYVRLDAAKINIAARPGDATWFKLVSVAIGNGTPQYPSGDHIQVAEPWTPPTAFAGVDEGLANLILNDFDKGPGAEQRYSNAPAADDDKQAWRVVHKHCPDKREAQCRRIIHAWLESGLLYSKQYRDPVQRRKVGGLYVNKGKRPATTTYA
jgi:AAA domain